ncbi:hypothetical protein ACPAVH_18290 [Enterobacteriaceae bacterium TYF_5]
MPAFTQRRYIAGTFVVIGMIILPAAACLACFVSASSGIIPSEFNLS